jgi:hypothetical protein
MEMNMRQEIYASLRVVLPEDWAESAQRHAEIARAWADMIAQIGGLDGVQCSVSLSEVHAKATRKPRKKQEDTVRLVETPPDEAA